MSVIKNYLSLVKFSHTLFAMPFALIGFFLGLFYLRDAKNPSLVPGLYPNQSTALGFALYNFADHEFPLIRELLGGEIVPMARPSQ